MQYVELTPIKITTPSLESLNGDMKHALVAYRLGFYRSCSSKIHCYQRQIRIEMQPMDESEFKIWKKFLHNTAEQTYFRGPVEFEEARAPVEILEHYEKALNTLAFDMFEIWYRDMPPYLFLLVGMESIEIANVSSPRRGPRKWYIIAKWQFGATTKLLSLEDVRARNI